MQTPQSERKVHNPWRPRGYNTEPQKVVLGPWNGMEFVLMFWSLHNVGDYFNPYTFILWIWIAISQCFFAIVFGKQEVLILFLISLKYMNHIVDIVVHNSLVSRQLKTKLSDKQKKKTNKIEEKKLKMKNTVETYLCKLLYLQLSH